jgi:hypothetical protein
MRSRSLVCVSSRALATCLDEKGESHTHVERCVGLHVCKLERHCQGMLCFEVSDGFDVLVQVHVASAEVSVRPALPRPAVHLQKCTWRTSTSMRAKRTRRWHISKSTCHGVCNGCATGRDTCAGGEQTRGEDTPMLTCSGCRVLRVTAQITRRWLRKKPHWAGV